MDYDNSGPRRAVFVGGCRVPFLRSGTGYRDLTSYDLARMALQRLIFRTGVAPELVDEVILGTVVSNLRTSNVARDAALAAGIPSDTPAYTVTQACISSNQAISTGVDLIRAGRADVVIAGGTDSLSDVPITLKKRLRNKLLEAQRFKNTTDYLKLVRGLRFRDLLPQIPVVSEYSTGRTMGQDSDRLAARFGITRDEQDQYALESHLRAAEAYEKGYLQKEVEAVEVPPGFETFTRDNGVRADTSLDKLAKLPPAFYRPHGTATAGNSSFLSDGAAAVLLMEEEAAKRLGFQPRAVLSDYYFTAQDTRTDLLLGPAYAVPVLLDRLNLRLEDFGVFEFHEAFAGQLLANLKALSSSEFARDCLNRTEAVGEIPRDKLNTLGGSLSLGHPFGATGARLLTTAVNRLHLEDQELALIASCAAGGLGHAAVVERCKSS